MAELGKGVRYSERCQMMQQWSDTEGKVVSMISITETVQASMSDVTQNLLDRNSSTIAMI